MAQMNSIIRSVPFSDGFMKSVFIDLGQNDKSAKTHILESLAACAWNHTLSRKLLQRFSASTGPMAAIIGDGYQLDRSIAFDHIVSISKDSYEHGDYPQDRLVRFVGEYLKSTKDAIILCENWAATRSEPWMWPPPRVACFGDDEVYHIVTPDITEPELIEAAVESRHYWQTGVCSTCAHFLDGDIPDEEFLDGIVCHTKHIFVPAFDGSGYLIWSPEGSKLDILIP